MKCSFSSRLTLPAIALATLSLVSLPAIASEVRPIPIVVACGGPPVSLVGRTQQIQFAPGQDSATVKSSVVRGTRQTYLLGAKKGQRMMLKISSAEKNAVFDLMTPIGGLGERKTLKSEAVTWSNVLPESGEYAVVVGAIRGNATYQLEVTIR